MRLNFRVQGNNRTDVVAEVDEANTVLELTSQLGLALGEPADGIWVHGSRLDPAARVGETSLRQGCVIALSDSVDLREGRAPQTGWQLHVVSGPASGSIYALPIGSYVIGREGDLSVNDDSMSRRHAELSVTAEGAVLRDLNSTNGTFVEGARVEADGRQAVAPGDVIAMGDSLLTIAESAAADAPIHRGLGGTVEVTRPPRLQAPAADQRIVVPAKPVGRKPRKIPLAGMAAPLGLGVVMAFVTGQKTYLLFTLMSPLMALGNFFSDRRSSAKDFRAAMEEYEGSYEQSSLQVEQALRSETERRRFDFPDPASAFLIATLPGRRIWERRRRDPDAFSVRLGAADLLSGVQINQRPGVADSASDVGGPRTLYSVPATVSFNESGVVGLAGSSATVDALARWIILQLSLLHAPRDLSITLLTAKERSTWEWFRWLPQASAGGGDSAVVSIGNDPETVTARILEINALIKARRDVVAGARADRHQFPVHLVVVDDARSMRTVQGLVQILRDGPDVAVYSFCLGEEERLLPEECTTVVTMDSRSPGYLTLRRSGHPDVGPVLADQVGETFADKVARSLSPLRDVSKDESETPLPDSVRLLDVLNFEPPTSDGIRTNWMLGGRSTAFPIGVASDGPFTLDLRRDGPHGLIAGTTGAGKSELLQSMIASLAVANRPDSLNFVLIDYKGGSAFKDCERLPHTVGMVTDLDAHLVERAIVSLSAELRRREHLLAAADAKDIEDYQDLADRGASLPPLPRLVLIIDEFASMARELPDFVTGLVNIAQRGRSLGIHLILATQRPSGVVSQEIRANTNLRISLRVTDAADSSDVIEAPDAARIPKSAPGRAYARLGHSALVPFQAGRIGGRRPGADPVNISPPFVVPLGWSQLGYSPPERTATSVREDGVATDLSELVSVIEQAVGEEGISDQQQPWLPPLPTTLLMNDLPIQQPNSDELLIPYGLEDLPAEQLQRPASFDLSGGHLLVIGSARSGRSQLLRTLAASAARAYSPAVVQIVGLDCGNGALLPLTELPHCGAIVGRTQVDRALRFVSRLSAELERRQAILASNGFADINEQRKAATVPDRLPHILLLLDRWEGFTSSLAELEAGKPMEAILSVLREGGSVGIHAIITGDRTLASGRTGSLCDNKLALRLAEKSDYTYVGISPRQLPDEIPPGRGLNTESLTEVQISLLDADESGQAQAAAISDIAKSSRGLYEGEDFPNPIRIDELPSRITLADAMQLPRPQAPLFALVGVGGDELAALGPDLAVNPAFVVGGSNRAGCSSTLLVMATSLLGSGAEVVVVAPRPSPLRGLEGQSGVRSVIIDPKTGVAEWNEVLGVRDGCPLVVIVDNGEDLRETPADAMLRSIIQGGGERGSALILGGNLSGICTGISGWQVDVKRARQGLLLSPQNMTDGDLIGARLPRNSVSGASQPGRGLLHLGGGVATSVTLPMLNGDSK